MPRAPRPGDFIPRNLITDRAQHDAVLATAENQDEQKKYAQWAPEYQWRGLLYYDQCWRWSDTNVNTNNITPDVILGPEPEPLVPGSWVEVQYHASKGQGGWHKHWLVGHDPDGHPVTVNPKSPQNAVIRRIDTVRPYRDAEQRAIDKLQADGHIVTKEMTRTVKVLNTLGLLKD